MSERGLWKGSELDSAITTNPAQVLKRGELGSAEAVFGSPIVVQESRFPYRVSTFLLREVNGNPYAVKKDSKPISIRDVSSFVVDKKTNKAPFGEKNDDIMQREAYRPWQVDKASFSSEVPDGLYEWIRNQKLTLENLHERIDEIREKGGINFLTIIEKYLRKIQGQELALSNTNFAIDISSGKADFHIEGEIEEDGRDRYRNTVRMVGQYNEIREEEDRTSIIRMRRKSGKPGFSDLISLSISKLAYKAHLAANEEEEVEPELLVFNLTNGKLHKLKIYPRSFDKAFINLIFFANLAKKAGYVPEDKFEGLAMIDNRDSKPRGKKIIIDLGKKKGTLELTAEDAYKKAKEIADRMRGESQIVHASRHFDFPEAE